MSEAVFKCLGDILDGDLIGHRLVDPIRFQLRTDSFGPFLCRFAFLLITLAGVTRRARRLATDSVATISAGDPMTSASLSAFSTSFIWRIVLRIFRKSFSISALMRYIGMRGSSSISRRFWYCSAVMPSAAASSF
ncbi:hypothetical protein HED55_22815 [Ochrobactrum haematophilum]|uniref:Transposase n=1 Tax=Brucella haematophila TaxID=419474 RepID=A0ABX1DQ71_9HYPH|nr:hypothetical protein [Brucella haematophila]